MSHRILNWCLALLIVGLFAVMQQIDGLDDARHEHAAALSLRDSIRDEQSQLNFQRYAEKLCGSENAVVRYIDGKTVQCLTKKGKRTHVATL